MRLRFADENLSRKRSRQARKLIGIASGLSSEHQSKIVGHSNLRHAPACQAIRTDCVAAPNKAERTKRTANPKLFTKKWPGGNFSGLVAPRRSYRNYRAPGRHASVIAPPRGAITPKSGCYRGQKHVIAHQKGAITNAPCDNTGPPAITKRGGALLQLVFVPWIARKSARRASSERASQFAHELLHACFAGLLVLVRKPT